MPSSHQELEELNHFLDNQEFGWNAIIAMYGRECDRMKNGLTRMVPRLKDIHKISDS